MTVFGKILTFVILVLALAQAGLHVMFHIAQSKYIIANQHLDNQLTVSKAEIESTQAELTRTKQTSSDALAEKQREIATLTDKLTTLQKTNDTLLAANQALQRQVDEGVAKLAGNDTSNKIKEEEVRGLQENLKARNDQIRDMLRTTNELRDAAVKAQVESKDLKFRNEQMVEMLREREQEIVRLNQKLISPGSGAVALGPGPGPGAPGAVPGGGALGGAGAMRSPPRDNVEGIITRTDPGTGMVTISIGSDAGVQKGNTLEVFRLNPPKYLGTIRILNSTPNEAVGKPVNRPLGPIQQGDRVASKILGT